MTALYQFLVGTSYQPSPMKILHSFTKRSSWLRIPECLFVVKKNLEPNFFCTFYTVECLKFRFWMTVEFYCWTSFKRGECGNKQEKICQKYLVNIIYQKNLPKICQKIGKHHRTFDRIFRNQNRCKNYFCGIHGILLKAERLNSGDWKNRRPSKWKPRDRLKEIEKIERDWNDRKNTYLLLKQTASWSILSSRSFSSPMADGSV